MPEIQTKHLVTSKIIEIRKANDLTIKEMAKILGMTYFNLYNIEKGKHIPTLDTLDIVMKYFNISRYRMFNDASIYTNLKS